jgi:hypothetical protein
VHGRQPSGPQDAAKLAQSARRIVQVLEQIGCDVEQAHSWAQVRQRMVQESRGRPPGHHLVRD